MIDVPSQMTDCAGFVSKSCLIGSFTGFESGFTSVMNVMTNTIVPNVIAILFRNETCSKYFKWRMPYTGTFNSNPVIPAEIGALFINRPNTNAASMPGEI